jgi:hypothetical protein
VQEIASPLARNDNLVTSLQTRLSSPMEAAFSAAAIAPFIAVIASEAKQSPAWQAKSAE